MRLDQLLVDRALFPSREKAKRAVMAGVVTVAGQRVDKPGTAVPEDADVSVIEKTEPYVSRAGRKLASALDHFAAHHPGAVDPEGRVCLDVGASTGGFTDCLLGRGASRIYAVDVGYGQLDQRLREDPRVVVMERTNARHLKPGDLPEKVSFVTFDVSFISLTKVMPPVLAFLEPGATVLPMIKPQFEVGRRHVGKGGIVRDLEARRETIEQRARDFAALGLEVLGVFDSPVKGMEGNQEAFALCRFTGGEVQMTGRPAGDGVARGAADDA
ncbi:MAG: TlyA family RNA methyltransferase [Acidobacteriota bacterium]